ncbi:MAG TPA: zinc ribbon domain-containing protein [Armatimonadota bacterium]|nr:zinc ribbon domain-containing protein [Armatimonadota bacterium]
MRGKNQRWKPPSGWIIVENAHQALITEDEAKRVIEVRKSIHRKGLQAASNRSRSSSYLLSGGSFVCGRCGSHMMGYRRSGEGTYYICGSQPYRKGMGCGPGVYVPQQGLEQEVIAGLRELVGICADPNGFTRQVNEELRRLWEESVGYNPTDGEQLERIEAKLANIRRAIEDGLADTTWANSRLRELSAERDGLILASQALGRPPQIDRDTAMAYRAQADKIMGTGTYAEKKQLIRSCVDRITIAPDTLEVEIQYKVPEAIGALSGSGGVLRCYLHRTSRLAGQAVSVGEEWETWRTPFDLSYDVSQRVIIWSNCLMM